IPTTTSSFCAIIQLPSLLGSGSKPVQLFGFKEDTGSVPRSPTGSRPLSTNGIRSSDGRLVRTARSHILADFADTRARRTPLKPLRREGRMIPPTPVVTTVCYLFAHGAWVQAGTRPSLRPLVFEGGSRPRPPARRQTSRASLTRDVRRITRGLAGQHCSCWEKLARAASPRAPVGGVLREIAVRGLFTDVVLLVVAMALGGVERNGRR